MRRLHDTGRSGWWYLLSVPGIALSQAANRTLSPENMITPMAMALVSLAFSVPVFIWLCEDSQPGANASARTRSWQGPGHGDHAAFCRWLRRMSRRTSISIPP